MPEDFNSYFTAVAVLLLFVTARRIITLKCSYSDHDGFGQLRQS